MFNLIVSASLCWLGVHASSEYFNSRNAGGCQADGGEPISSESECKVNAKQALGYRFSAFTVNTANYSPGCSVINGDVYYNTATGGPGCHQTVLKGGSYHWVTCLCKRGGGGGDGSGGDDGAADKVCIDVRKKKACKALPQCNFDRQSSPMCTDKVPGNKIPIKDFCEIIPTRGWCKRVDECAWMGDKCLLKSDADCTDVKKRRICNSYRAKNDGGCLSGKNCFWMGKCVATYGAGSC